MKQIEANHHPEKVFLCETPPKIQSDGLSGYNEKIAVFNHMLNLHYEHNEHYEVIPLKALQASKKNMTAYYHKNIHLNDAMGTPHLQKTLPVFPASPVG